MTPIFESLYDGIAERMEYARGETPTMSTPSPLSNETLSPATSADAHLRNVHHRIARSLKAPVQFLSFWAAIVLPFAHVALLANGLDGLGTIATFSALLVANVVALYVGHGYNQS